MRRGRIFIFLALILIVGMVVVFILFGGSLLPGASQPTATPDMVYILTVGQRIDEGKQIQEDMLDTMAIPRGQQLENTFTDAEKGQVVGQFARYPLEQGLPITAAMISPERNVADQGPAWATTISEGMVAVSIPSDRLTSVAYGVADGAYVNVIACLLLVDVDPSFQTILPNNTAVLVGTGTLPETLPVWSMSVTEGGVQGRLELEPSIQQLFYVTPSEIQRPRLVCQTIIQDSKVLHLGDFPLDPNAWGEPVVEEPVATTAEPNQQQQADTQQQELPPDIVTLIVTPEEAVSLNYLVYSDAHLTLALRGTGDRGRIQAESVTLQSLLSIYNISPPVKLPYAIHPPVYDLVSPVETIIIPPQ